MKDGFRPPTPLRCPSTSDTRPPHILRVRYILCLSTVWYRGRSNLVGAGSADECSESYAHPEVFRGGKCARVKNWQEDAQPEWPEVESGARDLPEAERNADGTEVLPTTRVFPPVGGPSMTGSEPGRGAGTAGSGPARPAGSAASLDSSKFAGAASDSGWFTGSGADPRGQEGPTADRTGIPGARIAGHGRRAPGQEPPAQSRISWGTTGPTGANPGRSGSDDALDGGAAANGASPRGDLFGKGAPSAPVPDAGSAPDHDRTDVLPAAGPTRAFPAPAAPSGPATAALRDPWQELPDQDGDAGAGTAGGHTHDPHEVTVQLDAVRLGDGELLRADGDHRKSSRDTSDGPVFVDESGRRSRLYRRLGILVGIACAVYAVVIVSTLLSGNSDAPWMPVPGQEKEAPAEQADTTPAPSESVRPSDSGAATPSASSSSDSGAAAGTGVEAPASGTTGSTATQPGASTGPQSSTPGTDQSTGGSGTTGPDPSQPAQTPPPVDTDPPPPTGGGDEPTGDPTGPTGSPDPGTDPGDGGTGPNGAGDPDPVADQAGPPVVVAGPTDPPTSASLSPENTL